MNLSSRQQRAIITGASSGIGRATAIAFAKAGVAVALVSRSVDKLAAVATAVRDVGGEATVYPVDLAKIEEVKNRIESIVQDFTPVDILVNSAGLGYTNNLSNTSLADWQMVMNLNLTSVFQCALGVLPGMRQRQQGTIINIASIAAHTPFPGWGAYSVSKAALVALSKVLAAEERAHGIRVMTISPGAVNTPVWDSDTVQADFDRSLMLAPETVAQFIVQAALLPPEATIEAMTLMPSAGAL